MLTKGADVCVRTLTDKQERFVQECAKGKTQYEAYIIAYNAKTMKETTIRAKAHQEMCKPHVRQRYDELHKIIRDKAEKNTIFTVEGILTDLKELIERNKGEDDRVAIDGIKTVMKHLGMFVDKVEHSGEIGIVDKQKLYEKYLSE